MALTDNLVAYWKLDGDSTDSLSYSTQTDYSCQYDASYGIINSGAYFDGTARGIAMSKTFNTSDFATITISCWVKRARTTGNQVIVGGFANGFWDRYARGLGFTGNDLHAWGEADHDKSALTYTLSDTSDWHHVVGIFSSSGALWVDNVSRATGDISSGWSYSWNIGATQDTTFPSTGLLNAYVDEIGIWSRALTSDEISQLYNGGAGLQYPFGENSIKDIISEGFIAFPR